jgi:hypothetical protein
MVSFSTSSQMMSGIPAASSLRLGGIPLNLGSIPFQLIQFGLAAFKAVTMVADILALGWVGMWLGLSARKPGLAAAMTILFVMVIPTFAFCVPSLIIDLFFILWARNKLLDEFRRAALPPLHPVFTPIGSR